MRAYLTMEEVDHQAKAFLQMWSRRGGSWQEVFEVWSASKAFQPADRMRVRTAVHEILFSRCDTTEAPEAA